MRRLNQASDNRSLWREHQQRELDKIGVVDLEIAFPGSLLCNQILVPANCELSVDEVEFNLPDVSHVVYEYCDGRERSTLFESSVVIDIDREIDDDSIANIVSEILRDDSISRVVLLGKAAYLRYGQVVRSSLSQDIEVRMFEPDWMSSSAMHRVYRQASAVLFINSMRVLDAVATGCEGCLVTDSEFRQEPGFPVLQCYLKSMNCRIFDETCVPLGSTESQNMLSHLLVENSVHALEKVVREKVTRENAIRQNISGNDLSTDAGEDWLVSLKMEKTVPVIKPYHSPVGKALSGLRDRKTGVARKMVKLWDDPGAFFLDSQFRMLRIMGRVFQDKTADV